MLGLLLSVDGEAMGWANVAQPRLDLRRVSALFMVLALRSDFR
jgi:hypothetical protein